MGMPADENLPEVVPNTSPQALSPEEAQSTRQFEEKDPKFPLTYHDLPKDQSITPSTAVTPDMNYPHALYKDEAPYVPLRPREQGRILGLKRRTFWIVLIVLLLVVIVASVGGGVGGTMAARSKNSEAAQESPALATTSASMTLPTSTTAAPAPTQTFLNNQTGLVGFSFQAFSDDNFLGQASDVYRVEGFIDLPFQSNSYVWIPNRSECCVTFCQDRTSIVGWWCQSRQQPNSSSWFKRVFIGCGADAAQAKSRCE